ncbi:MAG: hypothetical protein SXQ77_13005, partial [Halobacteria archaeon]|nr:hypothetical protein [Halobacteria archaeon]
TFFDFATERDVPTFAPEPFTSEWDKSESEPEPEADDAVVLFPDAYSNYLHPGRLKATAEVLEYVGVGIIVPDSKPSGRDALSQGMIKEAKKDAQET